MAMHGWAWEHAKAVADRCAMRFKNPKDIESYLAYCGLSWRLPRFCAGRKCETCPLNKDERPEPGRKE